jgi:6-phosphogluconolactonase (cycloisomerase 2 family)
MFLRPDTLPPAQSGRNHMATSFQTQRCVLPTFIARALILLFTTSHAVLAQDGQLPASSIQRLGLTTPQQPAPSTRGVVRPAFAMHRTAAPSSGNPWAAATACPGSMDRYAFAQNGEDFYVISGFAVGGNTTAVRRYNATTNIWTSLANIPAASEAPAAAYFGGKIYVVTGLGTANALYIYNIATNTWSSGVARPGVADNYGAAAGAFNGKVYVIGGGGAGPTSTVSIYDIAGNSWSAGSAAPTPVLLAGYAQAGQFLYVIGGFTASPAANSTASRRLDMANNTWSSGPTFTPQRGDFGLAAAGTKLIAIGGDASGVDFFDPTVLVDELDTGTWPAGTWVQSPDDALPSARQGNSAGFISTGRVGGEIWTTAGSAATFINEHLFRSAPTCLTYNFTTSTGSIVAGTTDTTNHADDGSTVVALPFPYRLYDAEFSSVRVGSNGHLTFGTPNDTFDPTCIPVASATYAIGPYWTDQCTGACTNTTGTGLGIFTSISGVAPNRIFNIEWRTAYFNSGGGGAGVPLNYEVRLYERQASFDVIYGTVNEFTPPDPRKLSTGVQKNTAQFTLQGCDVFGGEGPPVSSGELYHYTLSSTTCAPPPAPTGFLYALSDQNGASNQIYGFSVNETTGALTALSGFPVATGANGTAAGNVQRLAIDTTNQRLYSINDGSDTASAYAIDPMSGALTATPFSPIALGAGNWNPVAVHPAGSPLIFGNTTELRSFNISSSAAVQAAGSPYSTGGVSTFSATLSRDGAYYYAGGSNGTNFAGFSVNAGSGVLTTLAGSPFNSGGPVPLAYATDSLGRLLTASIADTKLRVFTTASGVPTAVSGNPFASGLTAATFGVLHPNEQFYFVSDSAVNQLGGYRVAGTGASTTLTPVSGSPFFSGGSVVTALAMNQTGTFLFCVDFGNNNLIKFDVNPATGFLGNRVAQPANTLGSTGEVAGLAYTNTSMVRTAVSRKMHGAAGAFDINLPLTGTPGVECRSGSGAGSNDHQIVVSCASRVVSLTDVLVVSGSISGGSVGASGNVITLNLNGVPNAQRLVLEFRGVSDGVNTGNFTVPVNFLVGDTVSTGSVNGTDVSQTKSQSGQPVTGSNFRNDVTVSGSINGTDVSSVKLRSGTGLP